MSKLSPSIGVYCGLILILAVAAAVSVFLPGTFALLPSEELPASRPVLALANFGIMLILYGGLGLAGLKLARKLGFPDVWDDEVSAKERFLIPALIGIGLGLFLIVGDLFFSRFHSLGELPHPPFPTSLLASLTAGIGEELIFRLFFISFWVWLLSHVILKKRYQSRIFWFVSILSALAFAIGHLPAFMILFNFSRVSQVPPVILVEIILLNGVVSLFAAYYFHRYGFLAAVGIHFWTDVVWHVIWGLR
jgi:hypothetical protein